MKTYKELDIWIKSRKLATYCYELTKDFPKDEIFGLTTQIRRSAVSVPSNIAEGCGRNTSKSTSQFLYIARGSLYELEMQSYIAFDLNYFNEDTFNAVIDIINDCIKLANGLINYHQKLAEQKLVIKGGFGHRTPDIDFIVSSNNTTNTSEILITFPS
ncbi:MAG TPA: four helix bundle protein [Saprospiraceae bacterium]|nr:four helix bundle protein [Saprospiraceae bacterium]